MPAPNDKAAADKAAADKAAADKAAADKAAADKAAADKAAAAAPKRFKVELPDNPPRVVTAADRLDAIAHYKAECGIVRTDHEFTVTPVTD